MTTLFQVYCTTKFLIDMDGCCDIVGYFYDVAPGQMYKNWQGKLVIYSLGYTLLTHRISLLLHLGFASALGNSKDILLIVGFNHSSSCVT